MDIKFFLKNLWLWKCGLSEMNHEKENIETQWSKEFENLMRNRLIMGSLRYGKLNDIKKRNYNRIGYIIKKAKKYQIDKNKELLIDIANLCLLEFEEGNGYFLALDDTDHVT